MKEDLSQNPKFLGGQSDQNPGGIPCETATQIGEQIKQGEKSANPGASAAYLEHIRACSNCKKK